MEKKTARRWWDKLGKPQYGGELVIRANSNIVNFDPYNASGGNIQSAWMERLVSDDWTMDPAVFDYKAHWRPSQYMKGHLAERWELTDPHTYVCHLRKGIHWQNIPPANGREFTADDVVFHFNRMCGLGGFAKSSFSGAFQDLVSVTAVDKYTVVFKWKTANPMIITEALYQVTPPQCLENPEAVKQWGDLNDWHHAIGTGPFILKDVVDGKSATLVKNPRYWGHDERYPKNNLPYLDRVKFVIIPDEAEAIAAMRAGKIDIIDHISPVQAYALQKTNPEIAIMTHPDSNAFSIEPRNDTAPFNDIRVRKAMQMALDLPAISMSHYQGIVDPTPCTFTLSNMTGWEFPYAEWPQDLKDEYSFNPAAARKLLADAGYPNGFKTNIVADAASDLELMRIVRSYFAQIGIDMEIREMESAAWADFVSKGRKHDQLAHRVVGPMGHTSAPMFDLTQYAKGARNNWAMVDDAGFNSFLPRALAATDFEDLRKIMREANEYVAQQHFSICLQRIMAYSLCQPWVKGFNGQFGSAWAHGGGPAMLSFYLGRFWVDENAKKMG
jgi:peptide/nickel transport system substrate-binding protein